MSSIKITAVTTDTRTGRPTTLFNPFAPFLGLSVTWTLSADLIPRADLNVGIIREMIDLRTNAVFFYQLNLDPHVAGSGENASVYAINPSNTAGMEWAKGDIFGFRAAAEVTSAAGAIDATTVSDIHWFRLQDIFEV